MIAVSQANEQTPVQGNNKVTPKSTCQRYSNVLISLFFNEY